MNKKISIYNNRCILLQRKRNKNIINDIIIRIQENPINIKKEYYEDNKENLINKSKEYYENNKLNNINIYRKRSKETYNQNKNHIINKKLKAYHNKKEFLRLSNILIE